jgi:hypothetical protein
MNIVPFESGNLPAFLNSVRVEELNNDLTAHAGGGFPVISIKGKTFAVVRDGERVIIPNPKDPESPATYIEMVLLKANKNVSKVWYAKGYQEGSEATKPDCFSNDGVVPDEASEMKQSPTCATCKKNVWGSKISENGTSKGKACADSVRLAVAKPDALNDPYMIRVPPASIRELGAYGQMLKKKGVGYNMVVTKISFDPEMPTPKLLFKPVGFIDDASYAEVKEMVESDIVQNILAKAYVEGAVPVAEEQFEQVATPAVEAVISKAKETATPKAATKSKVVEEAEVIAAVNEATTTLSEKPAGIDIGEINLDNLSFDD